MPKYIVNGKTYNIPDDKVEGFERKYPDANVEYNNDGKTYHIPINKREGFLKQYPNAVAGSFDQPTQQESAPIATPQPNEEEYIKGFGAGVKQGTQQLGAGLKYAGGEALDLVSQTAKDNADALAALEQMQAEGKDVAEETKTDAKSVLLPLLGHSSPAIDMVSRLFGKKNPIANANAEVATDRTIRRALKETNGDVEAAKALLAERANEQTTADIWKEEAAQKMNEAKPTKGFGAWVGNMVPQMAGTLAGLGLSAVTKSPVPAQVLGLGQMGALTASTAGAAMKEARDAGATNGEVWATGLADAAVELATEAIPFKRYISPLVNQARTKVAKEMVDAVLDGKSPARNELQELLTKANEQLGGKLFSKKNVWDYIEDVGAEGLSEFTAEALQTITPMIYAEPENYPTLWEVVNNGVEGLKGGIFMGAILGGASNAATNKAQRDRRKQQGFVDVAEVKFSDEQNDTGIAEVLSYDPKTNQASVLFDGEVIPIDNASENIINSHRFTFDEFDRGQIDMEQAESYENGRSLETPQEKNDAYNMLEAQTQNMRRIFGLDEDADVDAYLGDDPLGFAMQRRNENPDDGQAVLDYLNAKATRDGMLDATNDKIDETIAQSNATIDRRKSQTDGLIHPAILKGANAENDRRVYIISGQVSTLEGSRDIDTEKSDKTIIVEDAETGKKEFTEPSALLSIDEVLDPEQEKAAAAEVISNTISEQAEREIEGILPFNVGESYTILDTEGAQHTVTILADTQDGNVQVSLDNAQEVVVMPKEQIQQMSEAYNIGRTASVMEAKKAMEQSVAPAEQVAGQAAPAPRIPLNELGEPMYEQAPVYDTWVELVELNEGNEDEAIDTANIMRDNAQAELDKAMKAIKVQGKTVPEIQSAKAEQKALIKQAQDKLNYWTDVANYRDAQIELMKRAGQRATIAKAQQASQEKGRYSEENAALGAPIDFRDYVMRAIATGGIRFIWKDSVTGTRGLGSHTGLKSNEERNARIWLLNNENGLYPEEAAEQLLTSYAEELGYTPNIDTMDALSEILDVVGSYATPSSMFEAAQLRHADLEAETAAQDEADAQARVLTPIAESLGLTLDEYLAWEEMMYAETLPAFEADYEQITAIFVEAAQQEEILNQNNDERSTENADVQSSVHSEGGLSDGSQAGVGVLQAEQVDNNIGDSRSAEAGQGSDAQAIDAGTNDISTSEVSGGAEKSQVSSNDDGGNRRGSNQREDSVLPEEVIAKLSEDKDEFGKPFILSSDGSIDFGFIEEDSDLTAAPIRLSLGENYIDDKGHNHGYGLLHIEAGHGMQIRNAGYETVEDFIKEVATNYTDIREGGIIADNQTYLLEVSDDHNNTLFIQLSRDGSYWNINSAGIFKKKYSRNKPKVHTRPAVGRNTNTNASGVDSGQSMGVTAPAGNSPQTSESKDTTTEQQKQEIEQKNVVSEQEADISDEDIEALWIKSRDELWKPDDETGQILHEKLYEAHPEEHQPADRKKVVRHLIEAAEKYKDHPIAKEVLKYVKYPQTTSMRVSPLTNREEMRRKPLRARAKMWEAKVGVPVHLIETFEEVPTEDARNAILDGKTVTAWVTDGEVYLYMPYLRNRTEVDKTYIHEVVAHLGMKRLLGKEGYRQFCMRVYNEVMTEADREFYDAYPNVKNHAQAADEYIAHLSEDTDMESSIWQKVVRIFRDALRVLGIETALTNKDIQDLLRDSYRSLAEQNVSVSESEGTQLRSVYHGSGSDFDKFDHSFMGTGEGHQAFGWGTYVTEVEGIGKQYAKMTSKPRLTFKGEFVDSEEFNNPWRIIKDLYNNNHGKLRGMRNDAERIANMVEPDNVEMKELWGNVVRTLSEVRSGDLKITPARYLYSVEIPDNDGTNYLEYGKPLSKTQLNRIKRALYNRLIADTYKGAEQELKEEMEDVFAVEKELDGRDIYGTIATYLGSDKAASEFLNENGYVGISYPADGGNAGKARNYVIFNESDLEIKDSTRFRVKEKAPETASVQKEHQPTVVSSADGTKVLKKIDSAIEEYENKSNYPRTLLGDIAKVLNARKQGSNSQYAIFEAKNGKVFTIRLADHNAKVSTFDIHNEKDGISIIITAKSNEGIQNDGDAHIVEYFYDSIKLRKANGKPLVEILKSIKQTLYSGEYKDTTGLAEREEVNIRDGVRFRVVEPTPTFYSNAERAAENVKQDKATPEQWLKMIEKNGGLKAGEDKWLGLSDWLKSSDKKTLTKQEVLDFIKENQIQIEEVEYAENPQGFEELKKEYDGWLRDGGYDYAWDKLIERYGYDSTVAFDDVGGELVVQYGNTASKLLGGEVSTIKSTRLDYTTNGLDNKREIALTVPTIESWNESDDVHFGDAGNGRAIAWVRFGETTDADGNRVLVIDEVQSKRHQEGREKGYNNPRVIEILNRLGTIESYMYSPQGLSGKMYSEREALKTELESLFEAENPVMKSVAEQLEQKRKRLAELHKEKAEREEDEKVEIYKLRAKQAEVRNVRDYDYYEAEVDKIVEAADKRGEEIDALTTELNSLNNAYSHYYNTELRNARIGVSPAPFEKNWAELAMKRMLRYAAENGFDKIAWTTGEQQAERYDISKSVDSIKSEDNNVEETSDGTLIVKNITIYAGGSVHNLFVDANGVVRGREYDGKKLSDIVGKPLAEKLMEQGDFELEGDGLRIGGEGMKAFYDQMIPSFMNKYGKKWGVKVGEVTMPSLEENNTMHSIDVTDAMRESVMQGQPMFRITGYDNQFAELQSEYDALDKNDAKALNEWREKKVDVVESYLYGVADNFGMRPEIIVFNGADEEQMREVYDLFAETFRRNGVTPPTYEAFIKKALDEEVFATYYRGGDVIINNIALKDSQNKKMQYAANLFHEDAHHHAYILYNAKELKEIWDDVKGSNLPLVEKLNTARLYKDKSDASKGNEFIAHSIGALVREHKPLFQQFLRGENGVTADDVVKKLKYKKVKANFAVAEILNRIKDEYQESRNGESISGGIGGGRPNRVPRRVLQGNVPRQNGGRGAREQRGRFVLEPLANDVAQRGLREMVGEDAYNAFLMRALRDTEEATRRSIIDTAIKNGLNFHEAIEDYLASLAELENADSAYIGRVKSLFVDMLEGAGIEVNGINDNEVRYLLWRNNLQDDGVFSLAEDVVMQRKLGVGRFSTQEADTSFRVTEREQIIADAKADGTYLKAPNGKDTNLTPDQWVTVRTDAFKKWFGDWEKAARIEKLRKSKDAKITGNEIEASDDLKQYKKNAQLYGRTLQGEYTNADTGAVISLQRGRHNGGINEVLQHNYKDVAHLQSVAAIPQIIENGIYIESQPNKDVDTNPNVAEYQMFVCGLNIGGEDYTVLAKMAVDNNGNRYYDHNLVSVEKGKLIDIANNEQSAISSGFGTTPDTKSTTNSQRKYKELISLLQTNSSKIVDANGEPKVVYHRTPNEFTTFDTEKIGSSTDWGAFGMGFYFSPNSEQYGLYGKNEMALFLNARNPLMLDDSNAYNMKEPFFKNGSWNKEASEDFTKWVKDNGYDAVVYKTDFSEEDVAFSPNQIKSAEGNTTFDANNDDIRFRVAPSTPSTGEARRLYDDAVRRYNKENNIKKTENFLHRFLEGYQDSMISVKKLMDAVLKETGNKLRGSDDVYTAENHLSSKNKAEIEKWERDFMKPLQMEILNLVKKGASYDDIVEYLMAKHGLERNLEFSRREDEENGKEWDGSVKRDYSGLTELTGEAEHFTEAAQQIVDEFEGKYNTDNLWSKINAATKESLRKSYDSGLMSKETYDKVSTMFKYYVPLRGWDSNVAADQYEYMGNKGMKILPVLKTAKGRTSRADDPIATLGSVGESSIIQGNRNLMKLKFLNFAQNNPTSLLTVSEQWYEQNADGTWKPSNPEIPTDATADEVDALVKEHEAKMEALGDKATKKRQGLNINLHTTKWEQEEHAVNVKRNGKEYKIFVNGNPIAAQAINGFTNPNANKKDSWEWIEQRATAVKNFMARAFTSMNPAFIFTNLARDLVWAGTSVAIKENAAYARQYTKNISEAMIKAQLPRLVSKWKKGTLDMSNPIEKYFDEFVTNGGETGFTQLNTVDDYKRNMERFIKEAQGGVTTKAKKGWHWIWDNVEFLNRSAEDTTRFMVYLTSRQMGRPITESIANAKDITVNFNKKGRGTMGANVLGFAYIFFNATIQSSANFGKLIANHPKKTTAALTTFASSGMIAPMVALSLQAMLSGDDDEPTYWDLPEWVRRNNIVIYVGGSGYVTIPLPHELRPFYGMGELAFSTLMGKEEPEVALQKAVEGFASLMPFDFTGNAGNAIVNFTPTIAQPLAQLEVNKDYFGTPIYRKTAFNEMDPEWTKAYKSTNQYLVDATEFVNELTGGDEVKSGIVDLNPAVIEHLFEGYLGGMAKTINRTAKTFSMLWDEDARTWSNVPVLSSFYYEADERTSGSQVNREYFAATDEADKVENLYSGYKKRAKMGSMEYAEKLNELVNSDVFKRYQTVNSYKKSVSKLNAALKDADNTDREEIETLIMELKVDMLEELDAMDNK